MLEEQIQERERMRAMAHEQLDQERQMVNDVVRRVQEQEQAVEEERMRKVEETRAYVRKFLEDRKKWLLAEKERKAEEERKIAEYAAKKAALEGQFAAKKQAEQAERDRIFEQLAQQANEKRKQEEYLIQLQAELMAEEADKRRREREKELAEKSYVISLPSFLLSLSLSLWCEARSSMMNPKNP